MGPSVRSSVRLLLISEKLRTYFHFLKYTFPKNDERKVYIRLVSDQ